MASYPYSEQVGKNRQREGWPGRNDWYQRMARNMARCGLVVICSLSVVEE
jgi:hypothetical protein